MSSVNKLMHVNKYIYLLNSFGMAVLISQPFILMVLKEAFNLSGIIPILNIIYICIIILNIIYNGKIKINIRILLFYIGIISLFCISFILKGGYNEVFDYMAIFFIYGVVPISMLNNPFNIKKVLEIILTIGTLSVISIVKISSNMEMYNGMGTTYSILIIVTSGILHYIFYRLENNKTFYINYIVAIYYAYVLFIGGSRGVILSILFLIVILSLSRIRKKDIRIIIYIIGLILIILLILNYFLENLNNIQNLLSNFNINSKFIDKNIHQLSKGDLLNGRGSLYDTCINGFINNPFIGNGIGYFKKLTGTYPHNFILQILYEGGLIFFIPMFTIILTGFIKIIYSKSIEINLKVFLLLTSTLSIPRLILSAEFWNTQTFWLLIACTLITFDKKCLLNNIIEDNYKI